MSYWVDSASAAVPRAALDGDTDADVAIAGGGLTGLWTAYYLAKAAPWLRIVILEKNATGFGASGPQRRLVLGALPGLDSETRNVCTASTPRCECGEP